MANILQSMEMAREASVLLPERVYVLLHKALGDARVAASTLYEQTLRDTGWYPIAVYEGGKRVRLDMEGGVNHAESV